MKTLKHITKCDLKCPIDHTYMLRVRILTSVLKPLQPKNSLKHSTFVIRVSRIRGRGFIKDLIPIAAIAISAVGPLVLGIVIVQRGLFIFSKLCLRCFGRIDSRLKRARRTGAPWL